MDNDALALTKPSALPELERVRRIAGSGAFGAAARLERLATVEARGEKLPVFALTIGTTDRSRPTLGLFGGVHGLEQVGSHAVLAFLESLASQFAWDQDLKRWFEEFRLVSIPVVNPGGMLLGWRSNPRGVDLMRNSPVEAKGSATPLIGGHRLTPLLPWYRGSAGDAMEVEARALVEFVERELFGARAAIALDVHSGFGSVDRIWYPYARSREPFPGRPSVEALKRLLDSTHPHHVYRLEPQALAYCTHGDLWDHLFDEHAAQTRRPGAFLPLTLEMGSWMWIRKNPWQLFSAHGLGIFNPIKPHRYSRTMRRHLPLLHFLLRATRNSEAWVPQ